MLGFLKLFKNMRQEMLLYGRLGKFSLVFFDFLAEYRAGSPPVVPVAL